MRFEEDHPVMLSRMLWHRDAAAGREGHTLLLCRRVVKLAHPGRCRLWVSAAQRFVLYVNGRRLGRGPSRSDPDRWGVRPYDLELAAGVHVVAVCVTHRGAAAGKAQLGGPGFLLVAAEGGSEWENFGVPEQWRSWFHPGWRAHNERAGKSKGHLAVGAGERFSGAGFPWGWRHAGFDDSHWPAMVAVSGLLANPWGNRIGDHHLCPDPLPEMAEYPIEPFNSELEFPLQISSKSEWEGLVDIGRLTNAYIQLTVAAGQGSTIRFITCEAPVDPVTGDKGNRDDPAAKELPGMMDLFEPGGESVEVFETSWFRAFRYLKIHVRTGAAAITLNKLDLRETRFPLEVCGGFEPTAGDPARTPHWKRLLEITHRTVQLCAHETTFDCPHHEQAQFAGDSRIQVLYHYLVCNDDRLARKCIADLAAGRVWPGLLRSHYPATFHQIIPTFSLHWIGMLNEFRQYRGDARFVLPFLPLAREIIGWFIAHVRSDGLLGRIPYAPFCDWAFEAGNPPQQNDGGSSILSALLAQACQWLRQLEVWCGYQELAPRWQAARKGLVDAIRQHCLDPRSGRIRDTPSGRGISLHAQTEAVLAGVFTNPADARGALLGSLRDPRVRQPSSFYYRHHVGMALLACGAGSAVYELLRPWFALLSGTGLTTLPENLARPRSDCHAWSVFSGIAPFTHVLGLRPDPNSHGMARMLWRPHPGQLTAVSGHLHTPVGRIAVDLRTDGARLNGFIDTPVPVHICSTGEELPPGQHRAALTPIPGCNDKRAAGR